MYSLDIIIHISISLLNIFFLCTIEAVVEVVMEVEIAEEIIEMEVALTGIPMAGIDHVHTENFPAYIMY